MPRHFIEQASGLRGAVAALVVAVACIGAYGQGSSGMFTGQLTNASGAALPGVTITVINVETGVRVYTTTSDEQGFYRAPLLRASTYTLIFEAAGFKRSEVRGVQLLVDQQARVDAVLQPGDLAASVTVTSQSAVALEKESSAIDEVFTTSQVQNLPLAMAACPTLAENNIHMNRTASRLNLRRSIAAALALVLIWAAVTIKTEPTSRAAWRESARPLFGFRTRAKLTSLEEVKRAGFDYFEIWLGDFDKQSEQEFAALRARAKELNLPIPTGYLSGMGGAQQIVGPQVDEAQQMALLRKRLDVAAQLGIKLVYFSMLPGLPAGWSRAEAFKQLVAYGKRAAAEGKKRNIVVALEPAQREKTDFINTIAEALQVIEAVNDSYFGLCVDLFHMTQVNDDLRALRSAGKHLRLMQVSNPNGRDLPANAQEYDYAALFAVLREIGYQGPITIKSPASFPAPDFVARATKSLAFFRQVAAQHAPVPGAKRAGE